MCVFFTFIDAFEIFSEFYPTPGKKSIELTCELEAHYKVELILVF